MKGSLTKITENRDFRGVPEAKILGDHGELQFSDFRELLKARIIRRYTGIELLKAKIIRRYTGIDYRDGPEHTGIEKGSSRHPLPKKNHA